MHGDNTTAGIEVTNQWSEARTNSNRLAGDRSTVNREYCTAGAPIDSVNVRSTEPITRNRCIYRLARIVSGSSVELAALKRTEYYPGAGVVIDAETKVLPWVTRQRCDEFGRLT